MKKKDGGISESIAKSIVNTAGAAKRRRGVRDIQIQNLPPPKEKKKKRRFRKESWIWMIQKIFGWRNKVNRACVCVCELDEDNRVCM